MEPVIAAADVAGPPRDTTDPSRTAEGSRVIAAHSLAGPCAVVTGLFAAYMILVVSDLAHSPRRFPFGDYVGLWSFGQLALCYPVASLYDMAHLHGLQVALGMPPRATYPFAYPPTFLLFMIPFGSLGYSTSFVLWSTLTLAAFLVATCAGSRQVGLILLVTFAPATTVAIALGQDGLLTAALMVGGLRLVDRRPVAAGILFGLLTYKPQFGLLVPVALLALGAWRTIASAAAMSAVTVFATGLLFGASAWTRWVTILPTYAVAWHAGTRQSRGVTTVLANAEMLGASTHLAQLVQIAATLATAAIVWWSFRHHPRDRAVAVFPLLALLATGYSWVYDLPLAAAAVFLVADGRIVRRETFRVAELGLGLLLLVLPAIIVHCPARLPVATLAFAGGVAVELRARKHTSALLQRHRYLR